MKIRWRVLFKLFGTAVAAVLVAGLVAPYVAADSYGKRLQASLERALGRRVDIGSVRFNVFKGPGFSIDKVVIHEDPSIGIEPIAYVPRMEIAPSLWSLVGGRFVVASIRLEQDSEGTPPVINLAKTGAASESLGNERRAGHPRAQRAHQLQIRGHEIGLLFDPDGSGHRAARFSRRRLEG